MLGNEAQYFKYLLPNYNENLTATGGDLILTENNRRNHPPKKQKKYLPQQRGWQTGETKFLKSTQQPADTQRRTLSEVRPRCGRIPAEVRASYRHALTTL